MCSDNLNKINLVGGSRRRARDNTEIVKYAERIINFCGSDEGSTNFFQKFKPA
jgi:hypothetical protein